MIASARRSFGWFWRFSFRSLFIGFGVRCRPELQHRATRTVHVASFSVWFVLPPLRPPYHRMPEVANRKRRIRGNRTTSSEVCRYLGIICDSALVSPSRTYLRRRRLVRGHVRVYQPYLVMQERRTVEMGVYCLKAKQSFARPFIVCIPFSCHRVTQELLDEDEEEGKEYLRDFADLQDPRWDDGEAEAEAKITKANSYLRMLRLFPWRLHSSCLFYDDKIALRYRYTSFTAITYA